MVVVAEACVGEPGERMGEAVDVGSPGVTHVTLLKWRASKIRFLRQE